LTQRFIKSFAVPNALNNILLVLFLYDALGNVLHSQSPVVLTFIFNVALAMGCNKFLNVFILLNHLSHGLSFCCHVLQLMTACTKPLQNFKILSILLLECMIYMTVQHGIYFDLISDPATTWFLLSTLTGSTCFLKK